MSRYAQMCLVVLYACTLRLHPWVAYLAYVYALHTRLEYITRVSGYLVQLEYIAIISYHCVLLVQVATSRALLSGIEQPNNPLAEVYLMQLLFWPRVSQCRRVGYSSGYTLGR